MGEIKINDLNPELEITEEEMKHVKGGLLLTDQLAQKVQKVRLNSITDGTSNTFMVGESIP